jgi:hypothetical protein
LKDDAKCIWRRSANDDSSVVKFQPYDLLSYALMAHEKSGQWRDNALFNGALQGSGS